MSSVTVVTGPIGRITATLAALVVLEMMLVAVFLLNGIGMWVAAAISIVCPAGVHGGVQGNLPRGYYHFLALALLLMMFSGPKRGPSQRLGYS